MSTEIAKLRRIVEKANLVAGVVELGGPFTRRLARERALYRGLRALGDVCGRGAPPREAASPAVHWGHAGVLDDDLSRLLLRGPFAS
jgi:hypothetical protein